MRKIWAVFWLTAFLAQHGCAFLCYHCHQTTKKCINGDLDVKNQKNCSKEERCVMMKYETSMPGSVKVSATIRDCAKYTEDELKQQVFKDMKYPARVIIFEKCDKPLCNSSSKSFTCMTLCFITFVFLLLIR
ncbi:uncharacterized protein [Euwallacea fornicatus]|uniref:uncharacterized protein n=1 Tax=Euwallacea fornicatus TaxID=995702 RepID=UPI00338E0D77